MIVFPCAHCAQKFSVKEEFAGRQTRCPTCKHPLVVPPPDGTLTQSVHDPLDGPASSLAQAGLNGIGLTLEQAKNAPRVSQPPVREAQPRKARAGARYLFQGEIARGGMGAVLRAVDGDIRREVAVKYLLDQADPGKKRRFVEEAQITGQLEHPNIVPVHELGLDSQKRLFFSMKMVRGRSLAQVIGDLHDTPRVAEKEWPLSRLLNILVNVCHALAYAHARGVIHRDLKPANIMVGDFGEVYVMDWGLAKVLGGTGQAENPAEPPLAVLPASPFDLSGSASPSKVETNREPDADLTQEGTILGTPLYMAPEQAAGQVQAIDQRSDIYALGAILYEMLTLQPPVEKQGGYLTILKRVTEGQIVPPEQREPGRARAGKIPRELAAVASKALARNPDQRYQSMEELRRDLELFQEGRSVSAKHDTLRELLWKFVKRHKGFSAAAAAGLILLLSSLVVIGRAWWETDRAYASFQAEQQDKQQRTRAAVPAFLRAARLAVNERQYQDALEHATIAVDYDPDNADAHLLRGQLLIVQQKYPEARVELTKCLWLRPAEATADKLFKLCDKARPGDPSTFLAFAELFSDQRAYGLADGVLQGFGANALEARNKVLEIYRKRIEAAWPGFGRHLQLRIDGRFSLSLKYCTQVSDLGPLQGMLLASLDLGTCQKVRDLTPLRGMPLTSLELGGCNQVRDLTPLRGLPLTYLDLSECSQVRDLAPLQGLHLTRLFLHNCTEVRDLSPLHDMPLTHLSLSRCKLVSDLTPLQGMKLATLDLAYCSGVRSLAPLRDMPLTSLTLPPGVSDMDLTLLEGMPLTSLGLYSGSRLQDLTPLKGLKLTSLFLQSCEQLRDLTPLHGMPLISLDLRGCRQLRDLTPLQGMKLVTLFLNDCGEFRDLTPLRDMPLTSLELTNCKLINDLAPLRGMRLTSLNLGYCGEVKDLGPLREMKLQYLNLEGCSQIQDLAPLQGMPLNKLVLNRCSEVRDLTPLRGRPLTLLYILDCRLVRDLTPLQGMDLTDIYFNPRTITQGLDVLRKMKSLKWVVTGTAGSDRYSAEEFWKKIDAGDFTK